ncbi:MAG TPA: flavin reductase family protein [Cyclobacteriaceae bacterium]|jgi:flavin reductase (DIM6/NTAB) family NADH-FMN oxidoreductase RutF
MNKLTISPDDFSVAEFQRYLQSAVVPRPIAFASTVDGEGKVNLSPFSFFNLFGTNPPTLVFSPSRRARDNTTKHTLENVKVVPEVVINVVNYAIVQQASLASTEYPKGVNEFIKSGLTPVPSVRVSPPRVGESPVSFECRVEKIVPLGEGGGAGNLVVCRVVLMHISEDVLDEKRMIDPRKLDAVARLGDNWYSRVTPESLFIVPKPLRTIGIGVDALPEEIRTSRVLTGNDLAKLANVERVPEPDNTQAFEGGLEERHRAAQQLLEKNDIEGAWKVLLSP